MGANLYVSNYKKSSNFKQSVLQEFYKGAHLVLSYLLSHMMGKSPLKHIFACVTTSLSPTFLVNKSKKQLSILMFSKLLEKLAGTTDISQRRK